MFKITKPVAAVDFETQRFCRRPHYPPKPVGVAIYGDGVPARYLSWGHATKNNATQKQAVGVLAKLWRTHNVTFHNSMYDVEVAQKHLGLGLPETYEDTLFLAYLYDPRAQELKLKPLADNLLGMPAKEQAQLRDWILKHVPGATPKDWSQYMAEAPGDLVGRYAVGDVKRTYKLRAFFHKQITERERRYPTDGQTQWDAYIRELLLMPVILRMESTGIRVDVKRLERDVPKWRKRMDELDAWMIKRLGGARKVRQWAKDGEDFNIGSQNQLANALDAAGMVTHWIKTDKGNRSVSKENLKQVIKDQRFAEALQKREILEKYINTYGQKWLDIADKNGFVYPRINQVLNEEYESGMMGTRTGRLSYGDSLQAIPNVDRIPFDDLPVLRDYVLPDNPDSVVLVRDYTQQEFRILAHYEDGPLLARYQADPFIDMHSEALVMINDLTGLGLHPKKDRRPVKDTGFGLIYGMGVATTAKKTKQDVDTARELRKAYLKAIPGMDDLINGIKKRCRRGEPIRTWGGRLYWVEEPSFSKKFQRMQTFEYKMINVLIQGSAGDCTKEAMIRTDDAYRAKRNLARLMIQVHDELGSSARKGKHDQAMKLMRESMESVQFDVHMLSDGKWGKTWGSLKPYKDAR